MQKTTQQFLGYIYITYCRINGKIYIGQKKSNIYQPEYYGSGKLIKLAINKYGINNFDNYILEWCKSKEELDTREKYWIYKYNSTNRLIGYNISSGGIWGNCLINKTEEEKNKIINKRIKTYYEHLSKGIIKPCKCSEETKKKLSLSFSGEKNPMYGKSAIKGKRLSEEHKRKISEAHKGKKLSEETKLKISNTKKESHDNHWLGRNHSQETKLKISKQVSKNNTGKLWICNKDNVTKFIKQNELNYYLNQGFCLGRKWVNNNE